MTDRAMTNQEAYRQGYRDGFKDGFKGGQAEPGTESEQTQVYYCPHSQRGPLAHPCDCMSCHQL